MKNLAVHVINAPAFDQH